MNVVAFYIDDGKKCYLYFLHSALENAITCLTLTENKNIKSVGTGANAHDRYTHTFSSIIEMSKAWDSLFFKKIEECVKNHYFYNIYSNFDDMLYDDEFRGRDGSASLIFLMKEFFGKIPVPYQGNDYCTFATDKNFYDEIDRDKYEQAVRRINDLKERVSYHKAIGKMLNEMGIKDEDQSIPF